MGLLDIINGMQQGPRGQPQPGGSSGGGMSPITMALLGLLAYKAVKHLGSQPGQPTSAPGGSASTGTPAAGGLGGLLGGLFGGGSGGAKPGASLNELLPGGLGGLLAGAASSEVVTGGLGRLIQDFQKSGQGSVMQSWVGNGPNQQISSNDLESAIGTDALDALAQHTGMSHDDLLATLGRNLPGLVDQLTPNGRLPTQEEASRMM